MAVDLYINSSRNYYVVLPNTDIHTLLTRLHKENRVLESRGDTATRFSASGYIRKLNGGLGLRFTTKQPAFKPQNKFGFCSPRATKVMEYLDDLDVHATNAELMELFGSNFAQFVFKVPDAKLTKLVEIVCSHGAPASEYRVLLDGTVLLYIPNAEQAAADLTKRFSNVELELATLPDLSKASSSLYGVSSKMFKSLTDNGRLDKYNFQLIPSDAADSYLIDLVEFPEYVFNRSVSVTGSVEADAVSAAARSELRKALEFYVENDFAIPTALPSVDETKIISIWG